jgi:signal transduction histidine kinase
MVNNMIRLIKDIVFGFRFKRAVRRADRFHHITHRKYMVLVINKKLEVLSKQEIKKFVSKGIFRKGITAADIENKAIYITNNTK